MFSKSYAALVLESGINRLFNSFRFMALIKEAKSNEEFADFIKQKLEAIAGRAAKKLPNLAEVLSSPIMDQVMNIVVKLNENPRAREGRNGQAIMSAFIGGPNDPGHLAYMLNAGPEQFVNNAETVIDFWSLFGDNIVAAKRMQSASPDKQVPHIGLIERDIFNKIKSLGYREMNDINQWMTANVTTDESSELSTRFPGTEILMQSGNYIVLKFPKGSNKDAIETLQAVGEMKPENMSGGLCTRRSHTGGSRAADYLRGNTIYAGLKKTSAGYRLDFQGVFESHAELRKVDNQPYGPLDDKVFYVILKDIATRVAPISGMTVEEIMAAVEEAKAKKRETDISSALED